MPPFIIVSGKNHLASWYRDSPLPEDWVVSLSSNGWTTNEIGLEWVKHFNKHSCDCMKGAYCLLMLDKHESHQSVEFEYYCKENKIVTLCMPAHSSHLLQPLDVGCFSPLKRSYSKEIENLMRAHISHIIKIEFFAAFKNAFFASFSEVNVREGFQGAGLIPFNPETVISKLDIQFRTPTPPGSRPATANSWTS